MSSSYPQKRENVVLCEDRRGVQRFWIYIVRVLVTVDAGWLHYGSSFGCVGYYLYYTISMVLAADVLAPMDHYVP